MPFIKGHPQSNTGKTHFKKGMTPWNKGKKMPQISGKNHPMYGVHRFRKESPNWKGGKYCHNGYIYILQPSHPFCNNMGYIAEHRFVVEKIIGRYLKLKEIVHHEGERDDNRPQMLIAFKHKRFHNSYHSGKNINSSNVIFDGRKYIHF